MNRVTALSGQHPLRPRLRAGLALVTFASTLAVTLTLAAPGQAASPGAGPPCASSFNPYAYQAAALTNCGMHVYPLVRTISGPGGAQQYQYDVAGNLTVVSIPPQGFDFATATSAQLALYGIPAEPSPNSPAHALWTQMIDNLHFASAPPFLAGLVNATANYAYSPNWAGYVAQGSASTFTTAQAIWYEEYLYSSRCSSASLVTWAGLGGYNVSQLAQNGTGDNVPELNNNEGWYEVLPQQGNMISVPWSSTPGQLVEAQTQYEQNDVFAFFWYDYSTGQAFNAQVTANGYNGSTADFVVERPDIFGYTNLLNFGTMTFHYAGGNGYPIGSLNNVEVIMRNPNTGDTLATPGGIYNSGQSFNVTQNNCN